MALVAFSPSSPAVHEDLQPFEQLAVKLSSCFTSLESDDADASLSQALEQVGRTFAVDECTLVAYDGAGSANVVGSWGLPPHPGCTNVDIARMPWLIQRLARNAVTAFTPATRLCHAASGDRAQAAHSGVVGRLAVPIVLGQRVIYGLMVGTRQRHAEWGEPVVERLRLVGEILGSGLVRLQRVRATGAAPVARPIEAPIEAPPARSDEPRPTGATSRIIGDSVPLQQARARIERVAPLDTSVLPAGAATTIWCVSTAPRCQAA